MPEGDTLRRLAARINKRFAGRTVTGSIFRHPRLATADLSGSTFIEADAQGKHLLCRFDGGVTMHLHLLMDGRVYLDARPGVPEWRRRFEIDFDGGRLVGVDIPLLHLVDTAREHLFVAHLGPNVCGPYDHDVAVARIEGLADRHLSAGLLDQRAVAGFGNIYAVETPFICGLSPFAIIGDIEPITPVVSIAAAMIRTNAALGPQNTTGRRLHTGDQWVLPIRRHRCPICGTSLQRRSGEQTPWRRRTAWCPTCQPESATAPDLGRAAELLGLHPARRMLDFASGALVADTSRAVVAGQIGGPRRGR